MLTTCGHDFILSVEDRNLGNSPRFFVKLDCSGAYTRIQDADHRIAFKVSHRGWVQALVVRGEVRITPVQPPVDKIAGTVLFTSKTHTIFKNGEWISGNFDVAVNELVYIDKDHNVYRNTEIGSLIYELLPPCQQPAKMICHVDMANPNFGMYVDCEGGKFLLPGKNSGRTGPMEITFGDYKIIEVPISNLDSILHRPGTLEVEIVQHWISATIVKFAERLYVASPYLGGVVGNKFLLCHKDGKLVSYKSPPLVKVHPNGDHFLEGVNLGKRVVFRLIDILPGRRDKHRLIIGLSGGKVAQWWTRATFEIGKQYESVGGVIHAVRKEITVTERGLMIEGKLVNGLRLYIKGYEDTKAIINYDNQRYFMDLAAYQKPPIGPYIVTKSEAWNLHFEPAHFNHANVATNTATIVIKREFKGVFDGDQLRFYQGN